MDMRTPKSQTTFTSRIPAWLQGWKFPWAAGAGLYLLVFSSWVVFKWTDPAYEELIASLGYLPLGVFAAVSAAFAARQKHLDNRTRRAWRLIAWSLLSLVVGDILYVTINITTGIGFPAVPDIFYLTFYPLAFAGILSFPAEVEDPVVRRIRILDLTITMISASGIIWYFIIAPTAAAGGETWLAKWVAGAYPGMDVLLISSIISLLLQRSRPGTRQALILLAGGMIAYILADIIYAWEVLQNTYASGNLVDTFWTVSYYLIGLSALRQSDTQNIPDGDSVKPPTVWQSAILSLTSLSASIIISLYAALTTRELDIPAYGLFIATAFTIFLTIGRQMLITADNAQLIEKLSAATQQLQANAESLEAQVTQRTQELQQQTNKLYLVSQIARDIAAASSLESVLELTAASLPPRFDLKHAALYLLDSNREFAVLVSASSTEGRQMLAEGYKLAIPGNDFIARTASSGEPTLASISDPLTVPTHRPLLPGVRSALALPLKVATRTIGVLDLQSTQPQAFHREEDIAVLQIIADQIGIAIERARLFQQVEESLKELQRAYGETTREKWRMLVETGLLGKTGYRFDNVRIQPIHTMPEAGEEAIRAGSPIVQGGGGKNPSQPVKAAIPIKLRGQSIGVVSLKLRETYNPNTIKTITLAVERLAGALESARLFEEARLKAEREQAISQVTTAISSASEFETILRTTVEEIGRSLGDAEVSIQLTEQLE
ncbi:MAG: GAF domain-containing protein [Chloroflexota bacterium]